MISQDKPRLCKLKAVFDKHRDAVISLTCPDDTSRTEFLLTPQEFPGFDAEDSKWLGHVYGKARRSGDNFSFTTGLARKDAEIREGNGSIIMSYSKLRDNQGGRFLFRSLLSCIFRKPNSTGVSPCEILGRSLWRSWNWTSPCPWTSISAKMTSTNTNSVSCGTAVLWELPPMSTGLNPAGTAQCCLWPL